MSPWIFTQLLYQRGIIKISYDDYEIIKIFFELHFGHIGSNNDYINKKKIYKLFLKCVLANINNNKNYILKSMWNPCISYEYFSGYDTKPCFKKILKLLLIHKLKEVYYKSIVCKNCIEIILKNTKGEVFKISLWSEILFQDISKKMPGETIFKLA